MDESAEAAHLVVMRAVLDKIGREDLLLKGGTALMFGYGIQRVSRDLDFDARRPIRDIEEKLKDLDIDDVTVVGIDTLKNTETITRYRVRYESPQGLQSLKVEISYRQPFDESDDVLTVEGIRFASLPRLIDQKLRAAHDGDHLRTRARDLYDLDFLATNYPDAFTKSLAERLAAFSEDLELLFSRYKPAFEEDDFEITDANLEEMVLRLHENVRRIRHRIETSRTIP